MDSISNTMLVSNYICALKNYYHVTYIYKRPDIFVLEYYTLNSTTPEPHS